MTALEFILMIALAAAATAAPMILFVRLLAGPDADSARRGVAPDALVWPNGVQEEEPGRWAFPAPTA